MQETGENQRRAKRVPLILAGREKQEAGRKTHEVGECLLLLLLQDLGYLDPEEMEAGESRSPSVPVALLRVGAGSLRMGPVVVVEVGA